MISVDDLSPIIWAPEAIKGVDQEFPKRHPFTQALLNPPFVV